MGASGNSFYISDLSQKPSSLNFLGPKVKFKITKW